jgi:hypothetical protein
LHRKQEELKQVLRVLLPEVEDMAQTQGGRLLPQALLMQLLLQAVLAAAAVAAAAAVDDEWQRSSPLQAGMTEYRSTS